MTAAAGAIIDHDPAAQKWRTGLAHRLPEDAVGVDPGEVAALHQV
jgi:hypothetical protein